MEVKRLQVILISLFIGVWVLGSVGCAAKVSTQRTLLLKSSRDSVNAGRTFYVIVRKVKEPEFLADTYEKISTMVYAEKRDPSILSLKMVWPEQNQNIVVDIPQKNSVGIYFLFTNPSDDWKVFLPAPLKSKYQIVLAPAMESGS